MRRRAIRVFAATATAVLLLAALATGGAQTAPAPAKMEQPRSARLYVFDGGILHTADPSRMGFKKEELATTDMSVACFLIVHPKGTLIWDTCAVPDSAWTPAGQSTTQRIVLPDLSGREVTIVKSLKAQLRELGYSPSDITHLALSHYHWDHTANANEFAGATWLVRRADRESMFASEAPGTTQPSTYADLRNSRTHIIETGDYDMFGDGTVVIKSAPGHTPGHQVLYLKLARTGGVVLSGDLYHYPEERVLDRVPTFEFSPEQTRVSRVAVDAFLKKTGAQLWIQHDIKGDAKLKKSPDFYE